MAAKKSEEYRKWLDGHALLGSETVGDIDTFSLWVDTVRQIYACVRRKTALVTLFLVSKDSLSGTLPMYGFAEAEPNRFDFEIEEKLKSAYRQSELVMFLEACLYLGIWIRSIGKFQFVLPGGEIRKSDGSNKVRSSTLDVEQQVVFTNKLHSDGLAVPATEVKEIQVSYRHILKKFHEMSLAEKIVRSIRSGRDRQGIMHDYDLRPAKLQRLLKMAVEENELAEAEAAEFLETRKSKSAKFVKPVELYLTQANLNYVGRVADREFGGNTNHALNAMLVLLCRLDEGQKGGFVFNKDDEDG